MDSRLDLVAPQVPGYDLGACVGRGASGTVWSATRVHDQTAVAVKVVSLPGDEDASRLARELSALACADVDGLVGFHEAVGLDTDPPAVALVLDWVAGGSLAGAVAARGHLSVGEAVTVLAPVARALAGLHSRGVVHADVSPTNVLLERSGRPLLADLGVARLVGDGPGELFGTEGFVAPEIADGAVPTAASDVYAVGALAWWCVSGAAPGPAALRPSLDELAPGLPEAFLDWTTQALASDPARRPVAAALALGYFDSAPCEPLRLVVGGDDTSLLTQRLRESAKAVEETGPARTTRRGRRRGLRRAPGRVSVQVTGLFTGLFTGLVPAGRVHAGRSRDSMRAHPPVVVGALVTVALLMAGFALAGGGVPRPDIAWRQQPQEQPRASVQTSPPSSDTASERGAPRRDAGALMQALADLRARVMNSGSPERLDALDVRGSAAMESDRASLAALVAAGERYRDVRFTVRSARLVADRDDAVTLEAVVDTSAHVVVRESGSVTPRPPTAGGPMVFGLRWIEGRWRIESVEAAVGDRAAS